MPGPREYQLLTGDVYWATFDSTRGREQSGRRPVVIVASNDYLEIVDTLAIVVPVTTTARGWPNHIRLTGNLLLSRPSWAMTEQPVTLSRERLVDAAGSVDEICLAAIRERLDDFLGL